MQTGHRVPVTWLENSVSSDVLLVPCCESHPQYAAVAAKDSGQFASMAAAFGLGTGPSPLLLQGSVACMHLQYPHMYRYLRIKHIPMHTPLHMGK